MMFKEKGYDIQLVPLTHHAASQIFKPVFLFLKWYKKILYTFCYNFLLISVFVNPKILFCFYYIKKNLFLIKVTINEERNLIYFFELKLKDPLQSLTIMMMGYRGMGYLAF